MAVTMPCFVQTLSKTMAKLLIVGGTGLTGIHAALHLRDAGHEVTLASRKVSTLDCVQDFAHLIADYLKDEDLPLEVLEPFDALVFAAGADIRQFPRGADESEFYTRVNSKGIPRFFERARRAGIQRAVYIGTFYPQLVPSAIATSAYVRSRHLADEGVRALNSDAFRVCSLNAPFILGHVPGLELAHLKALVDYACGRLEGLPLVAPAGGVNHMTSLSVAEAIEGALRIGKGGHGYLVGDENLSWKAYLEHFFRAAGRDIELPVSTDEHPLFPDIILYGGRNSSLHYAPEVSELGYGQGRVSAAIEELVRAYRA